jgi:hypothetical protein
MTLTKLDDSPLRVSSFAVTAGSREANTQTDRNCNAVRREDGTNRVMMTIWKLL